MRRIALALALVPLAVACNPDPDGDGLTNAEEKELGTDPENADSDNDGIDDAAEVALGTNPTAMDSDADGLTDGWEVNNGFDPLNPDADDDGFLDGAERSASSDPNNRWSWPFESGEWPDFSADAPTGTTGWRVGDTMANLAYVDQYGNNVSLYNFAGYVTLVDFSAGWCGPCKAVARTAEDMWKGHREDGFMIVHNMTDDWTYGGSISSTFTAEWAAEFGIHFPVVTETGSDAYQELYNAGTAEGYIPFMILLDQDMKIDSVYTGGGTEAGIEARVSQLLGE